MKYAYHQLEESASTSTYFPSGYNDLPIEIIALIMRNLRFKDAHSYVRVNMKHRDVLRNYSGFFKLIHIYQSHASMSQLLALTSVKVDSLTASQIDNLNAFLRSTSEIWVARLRDQNQRYHDHINAYLDRLSRSVALLDAEEARGLNGAKKQFNGCLKAQYSAAFLRAGDKNQDLFLLIGLILIGGIIMSQPCTDLILKLVYPVLFSVFLITLVNAYQYRISRNNLIRVLTQDPESEIIFGRNSFLGLFSQRAVEHGFSKAVTELGDRTLDQVEAMGLNQFLL